MKKATLFGLVTIVMTACQPNPEEALQKAQEKLLQSQYVSYSYSSLWPSPVGLTDTIAGRSEFVANEAAPFGYDYIGTRAKGDLVFLGGEFKSISHEDKKVTVHTTADVEENPRDVLQNLMVNYSPITFLRDHEWSFVKDTIINEKELWDYFMVDKDTTYEGKTVYAERHIFLNPKTYLLERFERRNYYDGKLNQRISYEFSDYQMQDWPRPLEYSHPESYLSVLYKEREKLKLLKSGVPAPDFELTDLSGKPVRLSDYKGQKVLLNFSMIRCGACMMAMNHFSEPGFRLADDRQILYINPVDKAADMEVYLQKYQVDFPVLTGAKETGKAYGVAGYPIFFLLDEDGVIEEVFPGYHRDFFNRLKQ